MADSDAANRLVEPDKGINNVNVADDDSKANTNLKGEEEVSSGEIEQSSNQPAASKTEDQPDEDDEMSTCTDNIHDEEEEEEEEEEEVKEMNYDKETMEELISKLHINGDQLPTIGKQLNNLRCRGRSTLLLFYRLWRNHL